MIEHSSVSNNIIFSGVVFIVKLIIYLLEVQKSISSVKKAISLLEDAKRNLQSNTVNVQINLNTDFRYTQVPDLLSQLHFIVGQQENSIALKNRRRYNMITMIPSLKSHLSSHACFGQLRNMDCISLPHESSFRRLYY